VCVCVCVCVRACMHACCMQDMRCVFVCDMGASVSCGPCALLLYAAALCTEHARVDVLACVCTCVGVHVRAWAPVCLAPVCMGSCGHSLGGVKPLPLGA